MQALLNNYGTRYRMIIGGTPSPAEQPPGGRAHAGSVLQVVGGQHLRLTSGCNCRGCFASPESVDGGCHLRSVFLFWLVLMFPCTAAGPGTDHRPPGPEQWGDLRGAASLRGVEPCHPCFRSGICLPALPFKTGDSADVRVAEKSLGLNPRTRCLDFGSPATALS